MSDVLIEIDGENPEYQECIICYELIYGNKEIWICPQCNINIHKTCVENLQKKECPHCRLVFKEVVNSSLSESSSYITLDNLTSNIRYRALIICIIVSMFICIVPPCLLFLPIFFIEQYHYLNLTYTN